MRWWATRCVSPSTTSKAGSSSTWWPLFPLTCSSTATERRYVMMEDVYTSAKVWERKWEVARRRSKRAILLRRHGVCRLCWCRCLMEWRADERQKDRKSEEEEGGGGGNRKKKRKAEVVYFLLHNLITSMGKLICRKLWLIVKIKGVCLLTLHYAEYKLPVTALNIHVSDFFSRKWTRFATFSRPTSYCSSLFNISGNVII